LFSVILDSYFGCLWLSHPRTPTQNPPSGQILRGPPPCSLSRFLYPPQFVIFFTFFLVVRPLVLTFCFSFSPPPLFLHVRRRPRFLFSALASPQPLEAHVTKSVRTVFNLSPIWPTLAKVGTAFTLLVSRFYFPASPAPVVDQGFVPERIAAGGLTSPF